VTVEQILKAESRSIFEFTRRFARVSRVLRNLIAYSGRDTLTA